MLSFVPAQVNTTCPTPSRLHTLLCHRRGLLSARFPSRYAPILHSRRQQGQDPLVAILPRVRPIVLPNIDLLARTGSQFHDILRPVTVQNPFHVPERDFFEASLNQQLVQLVMKAITLRLSSLDPAVVFLAGKVAQLFNHRSAFQAYCAPRDTARGRTMR